MDGLIYDIFIKGVIPAALIGLLGYAAKKFISFENATKWKTATFLTITVIIVGGLYLQYLFLFSPYTIHFIPETSNIPGATLKTDSNRSYWAITKDTPISLPVLVKENREISVYLEIDNAPLYIEYIAERGAHKVVLETLVAPLFEHKTTKELQGKNTFLSGSISKFNERVLVIKAKANADAKIYSYTVKRYYTSTNSWLELVITGLIWLIAALAVIKRIYKKKIQPTAARGG